MSQNNVDNSALEKRLDTIYEDLLFKACETKEELYQWIKTFLGIPLPDHTLDEDSTSNPMDFIWAVYECALRGKTDVTTFVVAASRNSCKTLDASIVEFLLMLHFGRDVIHMAAILDQSDAAITYVNNFMRIPAIKKYATTDNRRMKVLRGMPISKYRLSSTAKMRVIVASKESSNAQHASVICYDEVDMLEKRILSESAMIGDPDRAGNPPIFIYLSSRKSASGPIQEKIDQSQDPRNGVALHKWSIADIMRKCEEEVHRPDLPKIRLWIHKETLAIKEDEEVLALDDVHREMYDPHEVFAGCKACPAFLVCKARAPNQKSQDSPILRDIPFIRTVLRETADAEQIRAQVLNLRPESSGVVYNKFNREVHIKNLNGAHHFAFGTDAPAGVTKHAFIKDLSSSGWRLTCGVDFGYTDPAAAVLVAYNRAQDKVIVLHTIMSPGFANPDWLLYVKKSIYDIYGFDLLCPDTADKSSPGVASKMGMPSRNKKPARIETGVSWIRSRLWSAAKQEYSLIILDEEGSSELFALSMERWQYKRGPMGFLYGEFEDDTMPTHLQDAFRYAIDPYVMAGSANYAAIQGPRPWDMMTRPEADKHLSRVESVLATPEGFQSEMAAHFDEQFGIRLGFGEVKIDNMVVNNDNEDKASLNKTGNFVYTF